MVELYFEIELKFLEISDGRIKLKNILIRATMNNLTYQYIGCPATRNRKKNIEVLLMFFFH